MDEQDLNKIRTGNYETKDKVTKDKVTIENDIINSRKKTS
jgi:hypothetical protein